MKEISATAEKVPTTLWMNNEQYKILIACGRCTTCFSLLKYLWQKWQAEEDEAQKQTFRRKPSRNPTHRIRLITIHTRGLKAKWLELKEKPF